MQIKLENKLWTNYKLNLTINYKCKKFRNKKENVND